MLLGCEASIPALNASAGAIPAGTIAVGAISVAAIPAGIVSSTHGGLRSASMFTMRSRQVPQLVQARVALATALSVAAPSSIAAVT
jgi:hypothetical protein